MMKPHRVTYREDGAMVIEPFDHPPAIPWAKPKPLCADTLYRLKNGGGYPSLWSRINWWWVVGVNSLLWVWWTMSGC